MNKSETKFQKALLLLDKGKIDVAEAELFECINLAKVENNQIIFIQAVCCIGDLFFQINRLSEAEYWLNQISQINREDDVLNYEINRARELLEKIRNQK